jgi:hypothetical protein
MWIVLVILNSLVSGASMAQSQPTTGQLAEQQEPLPDALEYPPYVREFFRKYPTEWREPLKKLPLEQQVEIGVAGFRREPSSERLIEAAVDNGGKKVIAILLRRLEQGRSPGTIDPYLLALDFAVMQMPPRYRLSKEDYVKCERAAERFPELARNPYVKDTLKRLKARTAS